MYLKSANIKPQYNKEGKVFSMTMGMYIRQLREELQMSQEELGQRLEPKVNRAAINKWETGQVENIKRCHIQQMSKIFGVSPTELMCFESKYDESQISRESRIMEQVSKYFGSDTTRLMTYYLLLNKLGKEKTLEQLEDMIELKKYRNDTDVTDEE